MYAKKLAKNGTIGIFCPSHVADMDRYKVIIETAERLGFAVKLGANFTKDTYGYAAGAEERADDLNKLVADDGVGLILFSGGSSAVEILPYIDYENIKRNPKLFGSYSDGTSILNAVYTQTGLVTYYGFGASQFHDLRHYDYTQFCTHFVEGYGSGHVIEGYGEDNSQFNKKESGVLRFESFSNWKTLRGGVCEGTLIGGYSGLFGLMLSNKYFSYNNSKKYLLFVEDHKMFSNVGAVSTFLAFIGQSAFMENVTGLIFGHYDDIAPDDLLRCLERFGSTHGIPAIYTDDFGHGTKHAIFPIGINASMDADNHELVFKY